MTEIEIHTALSKLSKSAVLDRRLNVNSDEMVNEAYLQVLEAKEPLTFENLRKKLNYLLIEQKNQYSEINEIDINTTQFKYCKCCNENLPIVAFGITVRKKTNKKIIQTYCSQCLAKKAVERRREKGILGRKLIDYPEGVNSKQEQAAFRHKAWQKENIDYVLYYQKTRSQNK